MIERTVSHSTGRFARCRKCGAEPRHIHSRGYSTRDPIVILERAQSSSRHALECRCGARTARHADLASAEAEWGADHAQLALAFGAPKRRAQA
jgi:hypothetical protein